MNHLSEGELEALDYLTVDHLISEFNVSIIAPKLAAPYPLDKLWIAQVEVTPGQSVKASDNDLKTAIVKVLGLAHRGVFL